MTNTNVITDQIRKKASPVIEQQNGSSEGMRQTAQD